MSKSCTRGILHVHAVPPALCPHVAWALESVAGGPTDLSWCPQAARPGQLRTTLEWEGPVGTGAVLASALRRLRTLHFEVFEEARPGHDAGRWAYTPGLGVFHAMTDAAGNTVITEDRVRCAYERAAGDQMALLREFSLALGEAWDTELEPLRTGAGEPARTLTLVG